MTSWLCYCKWIAWADDLSAIFFIFYRQLYSICECFGNLMWCPTIWGTLRSHVCLPKLYVVIYYQTHGIPPYFSGSFHIQPPISESRSLYNFLFVVLLLSVTKNNYLNLLLIQECVKYCALVLAVLSLLFSLEVCWLVFFICFIIYIMMLSVTQTVWLHVSLLNV